jgi:hypothetical protein
VQEWISTKTRCSPRMGNYRREKLTGYYESNASFDLGMGRGYKFDSSESEVHWRNLGTDRNGCQRSPRSVVLDWLQSLDKDHLC